MAATTARRLEVERKEMAFIVVVRRKGMNPAAAYKDSQLVTTTVLFLVTSSLGVPLPPLLGLVETLHSTRHRKMQIDCIITSKKDSR